MEEILINNEILSEKMSSELKTAINNIYSCYRNKTRNDFEFLIALNDLYKLGSMHQLEYLIYCRYNCFGTYINIFELTEKCFGLKRKYIEKCLRVCSKFIDWSGAAPKYMIDIFSDMSLSKIIELLPLSNIQINKGIKQNMIKSNSTFKELRDYVKSIKGNSKEENKVLEETKSLDEQEESVPDAFDPHKTYKLEYYKQFSKDVLINYLFEFERLVQKLLKKK